MRGATRRAEGFTAFKSMAVPPTMPLEGLQPVKAAEACVAAMREAVGDDIDIMVDCHARPSPAMGMRFAQALDPFGLYFFEEPCWPENIESLAAINAALVVIKRTDGPTNTFQVPAWVPVAGLLTALAMFGIELVRLITGG